jgi:protein-L-isoaspartate(D-aspartate) O-methyltransferase
MALRTIPRHLFVPEEARAHAYEDRPLPVGHGQTISQPYMVALMTEALDVRTGMKVLEVGTGTGYQTAVLCALGARVCTIERVPELQLAARRRLDKLGYAACYHLGDGSRGVPQEAPFDRILVTAAAPSVPVSLAAQLNEEDGRMIIPVGSEEEQDLLEVRRGGGFVRWRRLCSCAFVKLIGEEGW